MNRLAMAASSSLSTIASADASLVRAKELLRKKAKEALQRLTKEEMTAESKVIEEHLRRTRLLDDAKVVCIYVDCPRLREVETSLLLDDAISQDAKKAIYAPRVLDSDSNMHFLRIHSLDDLESVPPFGIREPRPTTSDGRPREDVADVDSTVDLVVMPGLAFDMQGRRLGRGGGYYDKFLSGCWSKAEKKGCDPPLLAALAFEVQMFQEVPVEPHDKTVDIVVTGKGVKCISERARKLGLA